MRSYKQYMNYVIVAVVELINIVIIPLVNSAFEGAVVLPTTPLGWILWAITNLCSVILSLMLLTAFLNQGKENVKENKYFKEAEEILINLSFKKDIKIKKPDSPVQHRAKIYGKKGVKMALGVLLSSVAISNAVIVFNLASLLGAIMGAVFALIFGYFAMIKEEDYWTVEYYKYAKLEEEKNTEVIKNDKD